MTSDECYTPQEWLQRARDVLGTIDTDPTSCAAANEVVRARRYFTAERDGLDKRRRWSGNVWFQPPYSAPWPFVQKLISEYQIGHCKQAIGLLNARPGSEWFQALSAIAWRCEKRKRIQFYGPGTGAKGGSGFQDNVFFYLGPNPQRFAAVFADVGAIIAPSVTVSVTRKGACESCGRSLAGHRRGAVVCSSRCRQRRHRGRQHADHPPSLIDRLVGAELAQHVRAQLRTAHQRETRAASPSRVSPSRA